MLMMSRSDLLFPKLYYSIKSELTKTRKAFFSSTFFLCSKNNIAKLSFLLFIECVTIIEYSICVYLDGNLSVYENEIFSFPA